MMPIGNTLRRSCVFCRSRKIKCSQEAICGACRRQGADCIYDFVPRRSSPGTSPKFSTVDDVPVDSQLFDSSDNVASALEQKFYLKQPTQVRPLPRVVGQGHIPGHSQTPLRSIQGRLENTRILSLVIEDLVCLLTNQFGSLGCHRMEDGDNWLFSSDQDRVETDTMFDNPTAGLMSPLSKYEKRQQTQLIEIWFSHHPLSFLVSKTLLLRDLRDGTHDEVLMAAMIAGANFSIGDEDANARGHGLLRWATSQLQTRSLPLGQQLLRHGLSNISSIVSTAQALMLLGWNALCSCQSRRAACYIDLAGQIATEIKQQILANGTTGISSRINGIDVFDVEKEIVEYLFWTTYSLRLWVSLQTGTGHLSGPAPKSLSTFALPATDASSISIQLDVTSENFSTLQNQKSAIREIWPLAHVTRAIAQVLNMYPQQSEPMDSLSGNLWQNLALPQFQQARFTQCMGYLRGDINTVLMGNLRTIREQVTEVWSRRLVLVIYHIMIVHFLFPAAPPAREGDGLTAELVEQFCDSTQEILQIFESIADQGRDMLSPTVPLQSTFADFFRLALDTCTRALSLIHAKDIACSLSVESPAAHVYADRLTALSDMLYGTLQSFFLDQCWELKMARKNMKACTGTLSTRSLSDSPGAPSPEHAGSMPSLSRSSAIMPAAGPECHSTALAAVVGSTLSAACPGDVTRMPSHVQSGMPFSPDTPSSPKPFGPIGYHYNIDGNSADELFYSLLDPMVLDSATGSDVDFSGQVDLADTRFSPYMMDFRVGALHREHDEVGPIGM